MTDIVPRQAYHHGDLALTLMDAALLKIERDGVANLSLRALARDAGVSATAPYRHFPSKRCLLAALATRGFRQLTQVMQAAFDAADAASDPADASARVITLGVAYLDFACAQPTTYQLMFGSVLDDFSEYESLQTAADEAFQVMNQALATLHTAGVCETFPLTLLSGAIWSVVHGMADLLIGNKARGSQLERIDFEAQGALQSIVALRKDPEGALRMLIEPMLRV
ncbi:MAG: TetR/AcrR family transcriptional regulator [Pseudomonadales bacterium]